MNNLKIKTGSREYPIHFQSDFKHLYQAIVDINKNYSSFVIITDSNVEKLYVDEIKDQLSEFGKPVLVSVFTAGEKHKNIESIMTFYRDMIKFEADRKTLVIALGGGVAGDMAGFCAATYMRGVDFIQIPTTLLSQVDSSVGGKTGIDFNGYKNIVGAFYQPMFVYINVNTLKTLPKREFYAGMGEVIKHGFIRDLEYVQFLEEYKDEILEYNTDRLIEMIAWSCRIKKSVVDEDEKENGIRALLNFGHTFGHAIERLKEFELIHGECVAIGMHGGLTLSKELGLISGDELERGLKLINDYHLPIKVKGLERDQVYKELYHDKKTTHNMLVFALIDTIGSSRLNDKSIEKKLIDLCLMRILEN